MAKKECNLITRSSDEARRLGAVGGKASGAARRRKRDMRERLLALLDAGTGEDQQGADVIAVALYNKAADGDVRAIETLLALVGQGAGQSVKLPSFPAGRGLDVQAMAILDCVTSGQIPVKAGEGLLAMLGQVSRIVETTEIVARLEALEKAMGTK